MKLNPKEFKRFKELEKLIKSKKATSAEEQEFSDLMAKKNERGSNDPKWWDNYPELAKNVTNLPFNYIPGTSVTIEDDSGGGVSAMLANVVKLNFIEAIGRSRSNADAFNTQIRQLWLDLHRKYRGIGTYEQADLGIAILAIRSVFNLLAKFERIYGVINTYQIGNRVVPNGLKDALGISSDLENNLADFRYWLNFYIEKMKQLCLPKGLSAIASDIALLSNVFKDSENPRAGLFLYDTKTYGFYNPAFLSTGGCITYYAFNQTGVTPSAFPAFTLADIRNTLETVVNSLLADDDIARMCSDLLAAYGPENVETLVNMPEQYYVVPVYDYERLIMFHNTTLVGKTYGIYDDGLIDATAAQGLVTAGIYNVIYQTNNIIKSELGCVSGTYSGYASVVDGAGNTHSKPMGSSLGPVRAKVYDALLDFHTDNPSEADIMVGSRLTTLAEVWILASGNYTQDLLAWGTQVVLTAEVFYYHNASGTYYRVSMDGSHLTSLGFNDTLICQYDWHPSFYVEQTNGIGIMGDIDNFTKITIDNLSRLHEVAILSGFKFAQVTVSK